MCALLLTYSLPEGQEAPGLQTHITISGNYRFWESNSDPHACKARTLLIESYPKSPCCFAVREVPYLILGGFFLYDFFLIKLMMIWTLVQKISEEPLKWPRIELRCGNAVRRT